MVNLPLKFAIIASQKSQQQIADLAHLDRTQLSHIVNGRRLAKPQQRHALAEILGKAESELFEVSQ